MIVKNMLIFGMSFKIFNKLFGFKERMRLLFFPNKDTQKNNLPITVYHDKFSNTISDVLDSRVAKWWSSNTKDPSHQSIDEFSGHLSMKHDIDPRILQLTTYPIEDQDHGGKQRCYQIRKVLRQEYIVNTLSFNWGEEPSEWSNVITLDKNSLVNGYTADIEIFDYIANHPDIYQNICEKVGKFSPTAILLEQPYLMPLVQRLIDDEIIRSDISLIYSSHNIEIELKKDIYRVTFDHELYRKNLTKAFYYEQMAIQHCDLAIAVSKEDARFLKRKNNKVPIKVFRNANLDPKPNEDLQQNWDIIFNNKKTNWVFVGSWHEPNILGLEKLTNELIKLNPNNCVLWVFGGAGYGLQNKMNKIGVSIPEFIKIIGTVSNSDLDAAILSSSGLALPILSGGGSNLKTAQALLSKKYVIGTINSFRSFESYTNEAGVFVCSSIAEFASHMIKKKPRQKYPRSKAVSSLHWNKAVADLPAYLRKKLNNFSSKRITQ